MAAGINNDAGRERLAAVEHCRAVAVVVLDGGYRPSVHGDTRLCGALEKVLLKALRRQTRVAALQVQLLWREGDGSIPLHLDAGGR
jgi:hypothetical protein